MIEPKLLKIEAIDQPDVVPVPDTKDNPPQPRRVTSLRSFFRRHKTETLSARPADGVRL